LVILTNQIPILSRSLGISLRVSFGIVIALTSFAMYFFYRIPGHTGQLLGISSTLALFTLPLAGVWSSGHTQSILINGLIPYSDALGYYTDAIRIMHGMSISNFTAMRPLSSNFLSFLLIITDNNLMASLGLIAALAGLSVYLVTREIQHTHGTEPAIFF